MHQPSTSTNLGPLAGAHVHAGCWECSHLGGSGFSAVRSNSKHKMHQVMSSMVYQDYHVICVELSGEEGSIVYDLARCGDQPPQYLKSLVPLSRESIACEAQPAMSSPGVCAPVCCRVPARCANTPGSGWDLHRSTLSRGALPTTMLRHHLRWLSCPGNQLTYTVPSCQRAGVLQLS